MTFAPQTLKDLAVYWTHQGGANLGIVGDSRHQAKGTSYHLGKSQLVPTAYSIRTARDKAGLTDAASALDLGRLNGSLSNLRRFSVWLVKQCRANKPGTRDVREVIFTPDGTTVYGWSREAPGAPNSALIKNYGDSSHLTHTHISFYRDSEFRDKRPIFAPYFAPAVPVEVPNVASIGYVPDQLCDVKVGAAIFEAPGGKSLGVTTAPLTRDRLGTSADGKFTLISSVLDGNSRTVWVATSDVSNVRLDPPPPTPNCDAAVAAAVEPYKTAIAEIKAITVEVPA